MAINRSPVMTVEDYFEWELQQERKHEYIDGAVYEMPGVSFNHDIIVSNLIYMFVDCLDRARFRFHTAELRVQASPSRYVYPDLTIVRGRSLASDASEYNLINPYVVLEVTSPSSMDRDRVDKLDYYYDVPSIEAYLIVDQHRVCAELYTRGDSGWQRQAYTELNDVISLAIIDCELSLDQVYLGIAFEET
ncbi:MAG: Uma2 family endonuclease [Chloroflexi bacterium]|nr:Uma2 family endonuclease [Chloroflexota bacterium]